MGKLYTTLAIVLGIKEIVDFANLTVFHNDGTDPQYLFSNYNDLNDDMKDMIQLLSCWIGMAKLYFGFLFLGTAYSNEPYVRAFCSFGAFITSYATFVGIHPAASKIPHLLTVDMPTLLLVSQGAVLGPLWAIAAYLEYQEGTTKSTTTRKED